MNAVKHCAINRCVDYHLSRFEVRPRGWTRLTPNALRLAERSAGIAAPNFPHTSRFLFT